MKKMLALLLFLATLMLLSGCGLITMFDPKPGGESPPSAQTGTNDGRKDPDGADAFVYTGRDHLFFDNSQTMFGFTGGSGYISLIHAVMQAEALRDPSCFTLQMEADGKIDKDNQRVGYLQWAETPYNSLRTCFADKTLYTFSRRDGDGVLEIPKLSDRGPMALLFEDEKLDPDNLNIMVTDMMENSFGATQVAAALTRLLEKRSDIEAALYAMQCDFSGNLSFPGYTTNGTVVRTVENYRGQTPVYLLVLGPTAEVEDFDARLRESLPDDVTLHRTSYNAGIDFVGDSGLGKMTPAQSLDHRVKGGNSETLQYTVNANLKRVQNGAFVFAYDDGNTVGEAKEEVQISLIADLADSSPFLQGGLTVENLTVEGVDAEDVRVACTAWTELPAWKPSAKASEKLESLSDHPVLLVQVELARPEKKQSLHIRFDLTAPRSAPQWIDDFSATVYEYQSLNEILPQAEGNHLRWKAGATDILSRTLDLREFDALLREAVPASSTVCHAEIILTR